MSTDAVWYLQEDTERIAPQTVAQLCTRLESGQLSPDAYVQHIKLPTWVPVAAVKGLAEVVAARRAAVETKRPTPTADTPWMITVDGRQDGPMSRADLARRARRGLVDKDTLVWREGMEGWVALSSVPALVRVLPGIESITETGQVRVVDRAQAKARLRKATPRTLDDCRRFLERTAGHEPTLRVLENMVRTGRNALGAVELLEEVLAPRDGWQRLMGIWRNLLRVVRQPDERTSLRMRMGQAAEGPLDVPAKALTIFTSALRESPRRTDVQAALRRLSDRLEARDATLEFVDTQSDAREGADRAALARFGGDLHLDWRDDVAAAAARYAVAARLDPNAATLDRLESLLERLDDWRPWTEALRAAADGVSAEDRVPYLHRLANAWQVRLERPARALGIYREILQIAPDDLQAMDALRRMHQRGIEPMAVHAELRQLFEGRRDFKALRDLDTAHLPHSAPGDERAAVLLRLASLARDQLSDPRAALDHLAHAVAQAPADEAIRAAYVEQAAALGVVEDAVATLEGLQGEHPSLSASLARSLFGVHRERTGNPTAARKWGRIAVNQGTPADRLALLPNLGEHPLVHRLALELLVTDPPADWDRNRGRLMLASAMADDEAPEAIALYRAILADDATHVAALTALATIFARDERWDSWFAARQALADGYVDENARIDVWRHSARRAAELSRQDDAAELWRRVLSARADDAEALDGLEQANAARGDWDGVADVLERRRAALDEADGLWITRRLAEVYADRLDDTARAAACWRAVVRIRPDDVDARRSLARLVTGAEAIGLWTALFNGDPRDAEAADALAALHRTDGAIREAFDVQLRHADSFEDGAEAVQRLKAVVAASAKEQVDLGPTPFQRILARTPNDADASDGLARVYAQQEDWTALATSLRERAERATDVPTRQALSRQLAAVQAENLGDPAAAFETLLAAFDSAPDDGLGPDLARLAAMSSGWSALLSAWTAAIAAVPVAVATPLHRRLARWYMGPQDDPAAAATHLGAVLAQRPDDADAVAALEALFADGRVRGQIIELLEPVYMRTQRQAELVEMLADTLPTGPERVPALRRLGALYDGLDRGREALDAFGQALETSPQDAELRADVTRVGDRLDRQDLVADVLGRALLNAGRPADVVALGEQLAPLLEGLGQRARATAVLQRILDADPRSAMALAALDAAATANGDLEAICDLLERRIEVAETDDRVELRARLAETWLRRDRVDAAIGVWQSARADRPDSIEPLVALDELYARSDDWEAVIEVRLARASLAPDDERAVLVESLVPIADTHGDAEIQLNLRRRLVDLAPTPERIDSLQEQLLVEERWADLESLATARLAVSEDTSRWFATLAKAQSAQGRTLEALESWRQVLDRAPADVDALQAAHALYVQRDEPVGQAQTALDLAQALPEDDVRAPSLARLAAGLYEELGQGADAVRSWAQVRVVSPDAEDAIEALTGHFTESGAWARLRDLLRSVLSRARSSDARLALHLQIAELSVERLDDQQSAREAYETALAESPGSPRATVALGRLYQETGDWSAWVELAMARLGDVQHPEARREIYAEAAEVLTDRLESPAHAFALLLKAVIEQPDDVLGPRIEALAKTLDRFPEAAHAYETALKEASPAYRRGMAMRLAEWFEGPLNLPDAAVRAYRSLLADAPDDVLALTALHRLFEAGHARESIAEELAERHRKAGDWERLHELLAASVPAGPPKARAEAWKQLGAVAADKLDAPQRAMSWYQMALNDAPDDADARGRLLRLGRQLDRLDQVAIALARALPRAETAVRPIGYALADLYDQLGDPEGSERTYELLLTRLGAAESAALAALDARYTAAGRWAELAARLQAAVDAADDPESKADFAARLARIHEHRLHQGAEAIAAWEMVLDIEPAHDDALASLGRLHQAQQDWAPLFDVYRREAEADPSIRGARYTEMARIATEHLGQPDEAATLWQKSLDAGGDPQVVLPALQALHAHAERWPQVVEVIDRRLVSGVGVPLPLLQTKARAISKDASAGDALPAWQAVLVESPNDLEALRAAWQLDDAADPAATAALARRLMAAMPADAPERSNIARARGRACLSADDAAGARTAWETVLSSEHGDAEAEAALSTLYGRLDDRAALVALRASQADRAETEVERIEAQIALASVQDRANNPEAASAALNAALLIRPDDAELAERVALMHFAQERFAEAGAALVLRADPSDPIAAQALHIEAATRLQQESKRPSEALDIALAGLALHPRDATMGALVEGLAAESDRWLDAIAAYRTHAIALDGEGQAARLRLASWVAGQVEDEDAAATEYEAILEQAPENEDAAVKLGVILRKLGRINRLVTLMGSRAEHLPSDAATRLRVEAAQLADEHLDADARASAWEKVLAGEPVHDKAFRALKIVYRDQENWTALVALLSRRADRVEDDTEITELRLAVADLHAEHLDNEDAAMSAYQRALITDPQNRRALQGVERVLERREDWAELVRFHEGRLAVAPASERHAIYARIAEIQGEKQGDQAAAEGTERVMRQTAGPRARGRSTHALEQVYIESGRWDELAALYERRLKVITEGAQERSLRTTLASIYAEKLHDSSGAIAVLEPLLESDDADHAEVRATLDTLLALHEGRDDWEGCAEVLKRMARTRRRSKAERIECFMRIGRIYADEMNDPILATQWWREALELDHHHQAAVEAIDGLHARIRRDHDVEKDRVDREKARIEAERARQAAAARVTGRVATGPITGRVTTDPLTGTVTGPVIGAAGLNASADDPEAGSVLAHAAPDDASDDAIPNAAIDPLTVSAPVTRKNEPFRMEARPDTSTRDSRRWVMPLIAIGAFLAVSGAILASVWPRGERLEAAFISFQETVAQAWGEDGDKVAAAPNTAKSPSSSIGPQEVGRDDGEEDVQAEAEVIKRTTKITERNLIAIETALVSTGLDYEALLTPAGGPTGSPVVDEGHVGGPPIEAPRTWIGPLAGPAHVLSPYGQRGREHHSGVDFLAKVGMPVRAIADGEIIFKQSRNSWEKRKKFIERGGKTIKSPAWRAGVYIELRHDDGKVSRYMHLHHIADRLDTGTRVRQRDVIGYVGRTAVEHSDTHLHFELREPVRDSGRYGPSMDPMTVFGTPTRQNVASSQLLPRIDLGGAPGGAKVRREIEQKLRSLNLLEKMDRLEAVKALLDQLPLGAPVDNYRLSSTFGNRTDPKSGKPEFHPGVDIPGQLGTVIKATAPGKVVSAGWKGLYGRVVEIDHGNGIRTRYGHLNQTLVRPGQQVTLDDRIGEMGDSGRSSGPHLHYEVLVNDEYEDPLGFLRAGRYIFKR